MKSKKVFERKAGGRFAGAPWLGATVRLKKGKRTATVMSDNVTIGNGRVDGGLLLDKPLAGSRYWNASDLRMVAPNAEEIAQRIMTALFPNADGPEQMQQDYAHALDKVTEVIREALEA